MAFYLFKNTRRFKINFRNFAHLEFEESQINFDDIKKYIDEKKVIYDHSVDQKTYKWSGKSKFLKKIDNKLIA